MTLSFDISTSCIGYALFDEKGSLSELTAVKFRDGISLFEKFEEFKNATKHLLSLPIKRVAIEEPLQKFKGKFSSAHTIAILNFFNGMISSYVYSLFKIEPIYYNVNNARSIVFPGLKAPKEGNSTKHEVWNRVMQLEPHINWKYGVRSRKLLDENYDMADAYTVGMAHLITIAKQIKSLNEIEKLKN